MPISNSSFQSGMATMGTMANVKPQQTNVAYLVPLRILAQQIDCSTLHYLTRRNATRLPYKGTGYATNTHYCCQLYIHANRQTYLR